MATLLASVSAFLGGFAATLLGTLMTLGHKGRVMTATIGCTATSAVSFIVAAMASLNVVAILHPNSPAFMAAFSADTAKATMGGAFVIGMLALFASLGLSGWTRSRTLGWITSIVSIVGVLLVTTTIYRP